jgi:hypothetical protein
MLTRLLNILINWFILLTSPIWIFPAILVHVFRDEEYKDKLLKGDGLLI